MQKKPIKIIHHLQNGEIRETMEGYEVPVTQRTEEFYRLLAAYKIKQKDETA